jgi:recombining binding protein (suppressor of hairless)
MAVDDRRLAARTGQWTAFSIHVLRRYEDTTPDAKETLSSSRRRDNSAATVTYGSEVLLTDLMTGVSSEPLIVRKTENKKVVLDATGPVSQLQKLAFCRTSTGQPIYLSTSVEGLDAQGQPFTQAASSSFRMPGKRRKREEVDDEDLPGKPVLTYVAPTPAEEGGTVGLSDPHEIEDHSIWTVIGISPSSLYIRYFAGGADDP